MALLEVQGITKHFRGLRAVGNVSFAVEEGSIVAMIGPNGAGKTTCFNLIAGVFKPDSGVVRLGGRDVTGLLPHEICRAGVGRTFQVVKPFPQMSVLDNVMVGALNAHRHVRDARRRATDLLALLHLDGKTDMQAASLTLPERKRLEVARAMATGPRLLLLDEVMAGLRPTEVDEMVGVFRRINRETGLTILVIEHVMRAVMALAARVVVLHHGEKICEGYPGGRGARSGGAGVLPGRGGALILEVRDLDLYYGDAQALDKVSLAVEAGSIVAIVGANGAGKSSLIRAIAGMETPRGGTVRFKDASIAGQPSHRTCELGIGQVAEGRQVFPTLSVRENLEMGALLRRARPRLATTLEEVYGLFPRLRERAGQAAGTLSGGEQQMLAIGRCLMGQPELIMLDEPSLGLAPTIVHEVFQIVRKLNERGMTIILVEQNVAASLKLAARAYVLENGRIVMEGTGASLLADDRVRQAYLGL